MLRVFWSVVVLLCVSGAMAQLSKANERPQGRSRATAAPQLPASSAILPSKTWALRENQASTPPPPEPVKIGTGSIKFAPVTQSDVEALVKVEEKPSLLGPILFGVVALGLGLGAAFGVRRWADRAIQPGAKF